jgi:phage terminase small subunit
VAARVTHVRGKNRPVVLNAKHRAFVEAYCKHWKAGPAAVEAGYGAKRAAQTGYELLLRADIQRGIAVRQKKNAAQTDIEIQEIIATLAGVLRANVLDYMSVGAGGDPQVDFTRLTRDQASVISELIVETRRSAVRAAAKEGTAAGAGSEIVKVRFKLHDKLAAADKLLKHIGARQPERHEHTGKAGGAIPVAVDDHKRAKAIAALLAKIKARQE